MNKCPTSFLPCSLKWALVCRAWCQIPLQQDQSSHVPPVKWRCSAEPLHPPVKEVQSPKWLRIWCVFRPKPYLKAASLIKAVICIYLRTRRWQRGQQHLLYPGFTPPYKEDPARLTRDSPDIPLISYQRHSVISPTHRRPNSGTLVALTAHRICPTLLRKHWGIYKNANILL